MKRWWLAVLPLFGVSCLVVTAVVLLRPDRGPGDSLITALTACVAWAVILVVSVRLGARGTCRSRPGVCRRDPALPRRSSAAGQAVASRGSTPGDGALRISPLVGPSVAPFTVEAGTLREIEDPTTWRNLLRSDRRQQVRPDH
jgi:hypothetical protein